MTTTTFRDIKRRIQALGMRVSLTEHGEYRVSFPNNREAPAYYTEDPADAVETAQAMASNRTNRPKPSVPNTVAQYASSPGCTDSQQ